MASASAGIAEDLFLLHRSGQVVQPFGIGELRQNFRCWRQKFRFDYPFQHNFVKGDRSFNPDRIALVPLIFQWPRNAKRVPAGFDLGKLVASIPIAVHGGSDRILVRNQLHVYSLEQRTLGRLHRTSGAS